MNTNKDNRLKITLAVLAAGIALNLSIAIMKLYVATRTNSVTIMLDASNSFLDIVTGAVTVLAFLLMFSKTGRKRRFGYGRAEYIASFAVSAVIIVLGGMFLLESLNRLTIPEPIWFSAQHLGLIIGALVVKALMLIGYKLTERKVRSKAIRALVLDSAMDVAVTAVSIISYSLSAKIEFAIDAVLGIVLSAVIIVTGIRMVIDSGRSLMGISRDPEKEEKIKSIALSVSGVIAAGRVTLHDYGFGRTVGTVEVCVDAADTVSALAVTGEVKRRMDEYGADIDAVLVSDIREDAPHGN